MVTRDVLKVLKLRTLKTSLLSINHKMHSRSYDFLYIYRTIHLSLYFVLKVPVSTLCLTSLPKVNTDDDIFPYLAMDYQ